MAPQPEEVKQEESWPSNYFNYFTEVEGVVAQHDRWKIDLDGMQLGFFSFSKLLMYRDLALEAWPNDALADHELTPAAAV